MGAKARVNFITPLTTSIKRSCPLQAGKVFLRTTSKRPNFSKAKENPRSLEDFLYQHVLVEIRKWYVGIFTK